MTPLAGPKRSRIVSPSSGDVERFTKRGRLVRIPNCITSGTIQIQTPTAQHPVIHLQCGLKHLSALRLRPIVTHHLLYLNSFPNPRFHQPKSEQQVLDQPLSGTIEAPIVEEPARSTRIRRPEPPPPKRSRIEFGSRRLPVHPAITTSARQVPISPPSTSHVGLSLVRPSE